MARLVVVPAATIFGRVLAEATGAPIRGARVTASSSSGVQASPQVVSSGEDGDFAFTELPAGGYEVAAVSGQWRSAFDGVELGEYAVYLEEFSKVNEKALLQSPGQSVLVRLQVPPLTRISGRVIDQKGSPVPEAWVRATTIEVPFGDYLPVGSPVLTDSDGRFTLSDIFTGSYQVTATTSTGGAELSPVAAGKSDVLLKVEDYCALSGTVKSAAGESVKVFRLTYRRRGDDGLVTVDYTNAAWSLPWLAPGTYDLIVNSKFGNGSHVAKLAPGSKISEEITVNPQDTSTAHHLLATVPQQ